MQRKNNVREHRFFLHMIIFLAGIVVTLTTLLLSSGNYIIEAVKTTGLTLGATLITTSIFAAIYQKYGLSELTALEREIRQGLLVHKDAIESGILAVYRDRRSIERHEWTDFIARAKNVIWLYGMAEAGYAEDSGVPPILRNLARRKGEIRILLLDPDSQAAKEIDVDERGDGRGLPGRIARARDQFKAMRESGNNHEKRSSVNYGEYIRIHTYARHPQTSIVRSDDEMYITLYLRYQPGNSCVTLRIRRVPGGIFELYEEHFNRMWESSGSIDERSERGAS